jgi:hypothetical protein
MDDSYDRFARASRTASSRSTSPWAMTDLFASRTLETTSSAGSTTTKRPLCRGAVHDRRRRRATVFPARRLLDGASGIRMPPGSCVERRRADPRWHGSALGRPMAREGVGQEVGPGGLFAQRARFWFDATEIAPVAECFDEGKIPAILNAHDACDPDAAIPIWHRGGLDQRDPAGCPSALSDGSGPDQGTVRPRPRRHK